LLLEKRILILLLLLLLVYYLYMCDPQHWLWNIKQSIISNN